MHQNQEIFEYDGTSEFNEISNDDDLKKKKELLEEEYVFDEGKLPLFVDYDSKKKKTLTKERLLETPAQCVQRLQSEVSDVMALFQSYLEHQGYTDDKKEFHEANELIDNETIEFFGLQPKDIFKELALLKTSLDDACLCESFKTFSDISNLENKSDINNPPESNNGLNMESNNNISNTKDNKSSSSSSVSVHPIQLITDELSNILAKGQFIENEQSSSSSSSTNDDNNNNRNITTNEIASTQLSKILELEQQLTELEASLGIHHNTLFPSASNYPYQNLTSGIEEIVLRLAVLHPTQFEALLKRYQALSVQIEQFLHKKQQLFVSVRQSGDPRTKLQTSINPSTEKSNDEDIILKLYDFCESSRPVVSVLPKIIRRLKALKILHQNSENITSRLSELEEKHEKLDKVFTSTRNHFEELKTSVYKNIQSAKDIVSLLENVILHEKNR